MLAKNLRAPRGIRLPASSLTYIASMLAPTVDRVHRERVVGCQDAFAGKPGSYRGIRPPGPWRVSYTILNQGQRA